MKNIKFGKFEWRVLEIDGSKALIITEHAIAQRAFHRAKKPFTWEHSNMRKYLNGRFFKQFSLAERARIIETKVTDRPNPWYGNPCGNETQDKIFLLSYDEVVRYFGDSGHLKNRMGIEFGVGLPYGDAISDEYDNARRCYDLNGAYAWWWLRSPGGNRTHTTAGSVGDVIHLCGDGVHRKDGGVRPAMWITL